MEKQMNTSLLLQPQNRFSNIDYFSFGGMLGLSILIGIYFGFCGTKQNTKNEYLMGGRTMKVIPIAISLIASHTSGIALLSTPADIYKYGSNYIWIINAITLACIGCSYVYMPVFHNLKLTSSYEYLNARFNRKVRTLASFLYIIHVFCISPITIYIPALAFSQGTGISVHLVALIICNVCIFYTTFGGVKAVVWTDTLQTITMLVSMLLVFSLGMISAGGFFNIIDYSRKGHHLELEFGIDPTIRDSFWTFTIGATFHWFNVFSVNQVTIQRLLAVPTISDARKAIVLAGLGIVFVKMASLFTGLIIFAKYSSCDPITSKQIKRTDELLPFYVIEVAGHIPGLSGLFISGVLSASLSTLSGMLNTVAATVYEDFIVLYLPKNVSEKRVSRILKLIVVVAGVAFTSLIFVVENLGGLMPLATSINGLTGGALLGLFTLGLLFPVSNSKGALFGGIAGLIFTGCIVFGNLWYKNQSYYIDPVKPLSINGCSFPVNITIKTANVSNGDVFYLFRVSFWYHTLIGTAVTIFTGLIISWFTKNTSDTVDPNLLSPVVNWFTTNCKSRKQAEETYLSVEKALEQLKNNI